MSKKTKGQKINVPHTATVVAKGNLKAATMPVKEANGMGFMAYGLLAVVCILPFLFSKVTADPVVCVRFTALSIFVFAAGLFFLLQKNKAVYALPLLAKLLLLVCGAFLVWSSMGVSGSINASLGIYEIAKYALLFTFVLICVGIILQNAQLIASLCKAISVVMLLQAMVGIFQYHGVAFTELPGANALPYGLMANRNLFGSALAFMLPFSVYAVYNSKGFWRIFSISSLAVCAYALVLSQTRSAWLGAVAVMLVSLLLSVLFIKPFNKKWLLWYGIAAVSILAIGYIAVATDTQGGLAKEVTERVNSLAGGNASDSASGAAANSNERIKIWKKTLQVIKDNPLTGVGFGNWKVVVPKYGTSGTVWETGKTVPDRVHNVYLQVIAETGWLGGILFILIWLLVAGCGLVALKKSASNAQKFLIAVLLGGLAAFGIDCMFSFGIERIEHTVLLGLMAAILIAQYLQVTSKEKTETTTAKKMPWLLPVCYMGLAAFCIFLGKEKYHFEKQLPIANAYQKQGKNTEAIEAVEEGSSRWVTLNEEGKSLELYSSLAYLNLKKYPEAIEEGNKALKLNPNSAMVYNNLGAIYASLFKYDTAAQYYTKALVIKPKFAEPIKNLAGCYYNLKKYSDCITTLQKLDIATDKDSVYLSTLLRDAKLLEAQAAKK